MSDNKDSMRAYVIQQILEQAPEKRWTEFQLNNFSHERLLQIYMEIVG